jgi:hypothetical protein
VTRKVASLFEFAIILSIDASAGKVHNCLGVAGIFDKLWGFLCFFLTFLNYYFSWDFLLISHRPKTFRISYKKSRDFLLQANMYFLNATFKKYKKIIRKSLLFYQSARPFSKKKN